MITIRNNYEKVRALNILKNAFIDSTGMLWPVNKKKQYFVQRNFDCPKV